MFVTQLHLTLCDPKDCSLPGSSVHGILQARILEWVAIPSSRGPSQPRDQTHISGLFYIAGGFFTHQAIKRSNWQKDSKLEIHYISYLYIDSSLSSESGCIGLVGV